MLRMDALSPRMQSGFGHSATAALPLLRRHLEWGWFFLLTIEKLPIPPISFCSGIRFGSLENTHPGKVHFPLEDGDGRPSR
jgi:hypothetical protein